MTIELRICGTSCRAAATQSSASTTSTGIAGQRFEVRDIDRSTARSIRIRAVGVVLVVTPEYIECVDVVRATQCGRCRENAERGSEYLRAGHLIGLVIAEYGRRLEDWLIQSAGKSLLIRCPERRRSSIILSNDFALKARRKP